MRGLPGFLLPLIAAGSLQAAERGPWSEVQPDAIRSHVEFLAADLLEGRATASRGYDIAAAYVASQFRQAGLQPAGDDEKSYLQKVPLLEATPVLPGSSAELVRNDDTYTFEYGTHYLPNADFSSASSTLSAPMMFAGFGIDAPELGYNDFENIDVKGRIAVIFSGAPAKFPNEKRAYYSWEERKLSTLVDRGAVGVITIDSTADTKRTPWERRVAMSWIPQMRWLDETGQPQNAFPALKLRFRFNHDAATQLFETAQSSFPGGTGGVRGRHPARLRIARHDDLVGDDRLAQDRERECCRCAARFGSATEERVRCHIRAPRSSRSRHGGEWRCRLQRRARQCCWYRHHAGDRAGVACVECETAPLGDIRRRDR